ncbi:MAG: glycosyltransferase [Planctomycetes bacterium]|nr:glycosyltransferase [Planctomycetota bacterium]
MPVILEQQAKSEALGTTEKRRPGAATGNHPGGSGRLLRVCHVSMTLQTGGLERLLVDFGRFCDRSRFELCFVALDEMGQPAKELRELGWSVVSVKSAGGRTRRIQALAELFRAERVDLVHSHNTYAHFHASMAARWAGVSAVINTQHGRGCGDGWKAKAQFFLANRLTRWIVGVSEDASRLCRRQDIFSARKIITIHNGIDLERFAFRGPQCHNTAISVARLSPEKDVSTLLRAVAEVVPHVPDFQLRIVGSGAEETRLRRLADELGIVRHVQFLGERWDVPELLARSGLFVSSSRTEGISLTLLEAMAVGLPVVATRVGGNPEIIVDGQTGRLVPSQDPTALAKAVVDLCRHPERWPQMGQRGRRRVEQLFDIRKAVQRYQDLYCQVLEVS